MMHLIPDEVFDQHIIALGKTGAGKSSAMRVLVEHLLDHKHRVIVVTAKADWWGLKLAEDGKHPGYPIPVFGGEHADIPLHHLSGKTVADLLGTGDRSAILQMRDFMPGERTTFWIDFASTLFRVLRGKLFLVIDEVHNFAPKGKVLDAKAGMMLHWSNKLASEARGLGITLIAASQRPAKVHNDFLTSCESLIAMRMTTSWDREAVEAWIAGCGDDKVGAEVLRTLAQMKRGDAWVWSPEIEFGPKQVHFPMFKTYDSFRPQSEGDVKKLKGWADVDLAEVTKKLESVVKEAEANDPTKLKMRIRELERQAKEWPNPSANAAIVTSELSRIARQRENEWKGLYATACKAAIDKMQRGRRVLRDILALADAALKHFAEDPEFPAAPISGAEIQRKEEVRGKSRTQIRILEGSKVAAVHPLPSSLNGDLTGPERKILIALSQLLSIGKESPPKTMVAGWAGYSPVGGAFGNPMGALRSKGLIDYPSPGTVRLTDQGLSLIGAQVPPTAEELKHRILDVCTGPERKILAALMEHGQGEITKEELASRSGYSPVGGAFGNPVGALRTKGFLDYPRPGVVKASDWLFIE